VRRRPRRLRRLRRSWRRSWRVIRLPPRSFKLNWFPKMKDSSILRNSRKKSLLP